MLETLSVKNWNRWSSQHLFLLFTIAWDLRGHDTTCRVFKGELNQRSITGPIYMNGKKEEKKSNFFTWFSLCLLKQQKCSKVVENMIQRQWVLPFCAQFSSVQDGIYALKKPICAPPHLPEVSPTLPLKQFQCSSDWQWPSLVFWRKIV